MNKTFNGLHKTDPLLLAVIKCLCNPLEKKTMVDLCCETARFTRNLPFKEKTFVDVLEYPVTYPGKFLKESALTVQGLWDVCLALDAVEHFDDLDGLILQTRAALIAETAIFFTPLGKLWVNPADDGSDPKTHKSGWTHENILQGYDSIEFLRWHENYKCGAMIFWNSKGEGKFNEICELIEQFKIGG